MKHLPVVLALLLLTFIPNHFRDCAQAQNRISKAERQLRLIEEDRRKAIKDGDIQTLDRIYAHDFSAIAASGQIITKEQLFTVFRRNDPTLEFTTDEISVRIFGNTAIFRGRLIGKSKDGQVRLASRFTHVFVKRDGRWQCVAGQSTAIAG